MSSRIATDSGCEVWRSNRAIVCFTPLSKIGEIFLVQPADRPSGRILYRGDQRTRRTSTLKSWLLRGDGNGRDTAPGRSDSSLQDGFVPFALHPHFAIGEMFLLPDRHKFLQPVDPLESGVEGGLPCGAVTTIRTLISLISMRPSR